MTPAEIMRACDHPGSRDSWLTVAGETIRACWRCGNAANAARRAVRKAALAARPHDCARCGRRPHTFLVAGIRLCGRCKTATMREHAKATAGLGILAMLVTTPAVDTSTWAKNAT